MDGSPYCFGPLVGCHKEEREGGVEYAHEQGEVRMDGQPAVRE
jgi:hypothetical protein